MHHAAMTVLFLRIAGAGVTYLFFFALAHVMPVEAFGILGVLLSSALLFSVFASFGQPLGLLRYVPPLLERNEHEALQHLVVRALRVTITGNALLFAVLLAATGVASWLGLLAHGWAFALGLVLIPLVALADFQAHLARAYRANVLAILPRDVLWRLISGAVIIALYYGFGRWPVPVAAALPVLIAVLVVLIMAQGGIMRRHLRTPRMFCAQPSLPEIRDASGFWVTSVAAIAFANLDVIVVGGLMGGETAAHYFAANRLALVLSFFQTSANTAIAPILSTDHARGAKGQLRAKVQRITFIAFVPTLATALLMAAGAGLFLSLFGAGFQGAAPALWILLGAGVVNAGFGAGDLLLAMCDRQRQAMRIGLWTTTVGAILIATLGALCGLTGVATGVFIAVSLRKAAYWHAAQRALGIRVDIFAALAQRARDKGDYHARTN